MIAVLVSGGKDSTATLLLAIEKHGKENVLPIFTDTGFEHSATYEYLDYLEVKLGVEIVRLKNPNGHDLISLILKKKRFPNGRLRFCTALLKQVPAALYLMERKDVRELWLGIRAEESRRRKEKYGRLSPEDTWKYSDWLNNNNGYLRKRHLEELRHIRCRFPIVDWSEEQVFSYLKEKGIEPNPLYAKGHTRVGCYPCVLAGWRDFVLCWQDPEGRENILRLVEAERILKEQGLSGVRVKDRMDGSLLLRKLELNNAQVDMFCAEVCAVCSA